jgi:hypothetical protein
MGVGVGVGVGVGLGVTEGLATGTAAGDCPPARRWPRKKSPIRTATATRPPAIQSSVFATLGVTVFLLGLDDSSFGGVPAESVEPAADAVA